MSDLSDGIGADVDLEDAAHGEGVTVPRLRLMPAPQSPPTDYPAQQRPATPPSPGQSGPGAKVAAGGAVRTRIADPPVAAVGEAPSEGVSFGKAFLWAAAAFVGGWLLAGASRRTDAFGDPIVENDGLADDEPEPAKKRKRRRKRKPAPQDPPGDDGPGLPAEE